MAIERYVRHKWIHGTAQGRLVCRYGNLAAKLILEAKGREPFRCPICFYDGQFFSFSASSVPRPNAMCPGCGALECHRLQWLTVSRLAERTQFHKMRLLHVAPEVFFARRFRPMFREYVATDLERSDVDVQADLTKYQWRMAVLTSFMPLTSLSMSKTTDRPSRRFAAYWHLVD